MSVDPVNPPAPISIEAARQAAAQRAREAGGGEDDRRDSVRLSPQGAQLLRFERAVTADSPERTALVERLKAQLRDGSYRPDPTAIARALLERDEL